MSACVPPHTPEEEAAHSHACRYCQARRITDLLSVCGALGVRLATANAALNPSHRNMKQLNNMLLSDRRVKDAVQAGIRIAARINEERKKVNGAGPSPCPKCNGTGIVMETNLACDCMRPAAEEKKP